MNLKKLIIPPTLFKSRRSMAIRDCRLLWYYLSTSKNFNYRSSTSDISLMKIYAVRYLYSKGYLSKSQYIYSCPLCDEYLLNDCKKCPWPGVSSNSRRCLRDDNGHYGYYAHWLSFRTSPNRMYWAKKIYNLIKSMQ